MNFREISDRFIDQSSARESIRNPASVVFHVRSWTNNDLDLTNLILQLILKHDFQIHGGEEEEKVESFIRENVIKDWEAKGAADHLNLIRSKILGHPRKNKILLILYNILSSGEIPFKGGADIQVLLSSSLATVDDNKVKIRNRIYEEVFNSLWVEEAVNHPIYSPAKNNSDRFSRFVNLLRSRSTPFIFVPLLLLSLGLPFVFQQRQESAPDAPSENVLSKSENNELEQNNEEISFGEYVLVKDEVDIEGQQTIDFNSAKQQGTEAIKRGDFNEAAKQFRKALAISPNAPETLIYLSNSLVELESERSYTIAAAVPITSDVNTAKAMLRGVAQSQMEFNQTNGIDGVKLKVAIADDGIDVEATKKIAEKISKNSRVLGVVGHYYSSRTIPAVRDVYEGNGLAAISLSSSVEITALSDYVFRTSPTDSVTAERLARYMLNDWDGVQRVAIFYDSDSSYSNSLKEEFEKFVRKGGGEVFDSFDWSASSYNPDEVFKELINASVQAIMLIPDEHKQLEEKVFKVVQLNDRSGNPFRLMGGDVVYAPETLEKEPWGNAFVGMVVGAFWDIETAIDDPFVGRSQFLWKAPVNWKTAMAYDATQAWIGAFWKSKLENLPATRTGFQQALALPDFSAFGASGEIVFTPDGDRQNAPVQLVEVTQGGEASKINDFRPVEESTQGF